MKKKLIERLNFIGSASSVIGLFLMAIDRLSEAYNYFRFEELPSGFSSPFLLIGFGIFFILRMVANAIAKLGDREELSLLTVDYKLIAKDDMGERVEYSRHRVFRPNHQIQSIAEGLHYTDGSITNPQTEFWTCHNYKGGYQKDTQVPVTVGEKDLIRKEKNAKIFEFQFEAKLSKKQLYSQDLKYTYLDSYKAEREYFKINVKHPTKVIHFTLIPDSNRPINFKDVQVIREKKQGIKNPIFIYSPAVQDQKGNLSWSIEYPDVGDSYSINWSW